jgi:type IV pilus assembly protein PilV
MNFTKKSTRRLMPHAKRQSGATLIEILVSVLILSFGMLGLAALQTRALQGNQSSLQRSQAIMMANYMLDAMRVDRVQANGGAYNINRCGAITTSTSTLAETNIKDWLNTAQTNLGGSADSPVCGVIQCTVGTFNCTVDIKWDDSKAGGLAEQTVRIASTI